MARQILVIGGNRFFGKRLIEKLIANGDHVTILNRGQLDDGFGDKVERIICDRDDIEKFKSHVQHKTWDVVYDQVCFDAHQAKAAIEIFSGHAKKFIFTSTVSVYSQRGNLHEDDFNPNTYRYDKILTREENYGEAKRQCEAVFFNQNTMPVVAVRFPIVMGPDDYTERLKFYVDKIKNGEPVYFPNLEAQMSFIHAADAAEGLFLLGHINFTGPLNMASRMPLRLRELVNFIEQNVGKKALIYSEAKGADDKSPYGLEKDWFVNIDRALSLGFKPAPISEWIVAVIKNYL
ncbi:NAD-dependent epimerase/dehydratase family protein [Pseudobdellovibrio sp. HCB154]|uniref:NAD-dependent epimerase/dehydratase family protein n=1 Tax=Pseudobdellovibrio sp. HCB154 TaxID=3386277 RepID=UPI003916E37C